MADQLRARGCEVMVLISPKEVDQEAVKTVAGMAVKILPAVGLANHRYFHFLLGFWRSYRLAGNIFQARAPQAVLAMGGFTSAPPIHAGRRFGAATFLHESNTIPGRANRWLARFVHQAFVGFPSAASRLRHNNVQHTGTPVRPQFRSGPPESARASLGLDPGRPVLLIMGGSQGASGVNDLLIQSLPLLRTKLPGWQYLHLTGMNDGEKVRAAYREHQLDAVVHPFFDRMELALGAATVAVSRAGASSIAELAALRLPSVLIPFPTAADNHQYFNARAVVDAGAAVMLDQRAATPESLWHVLAPLALQAATRTDMADAIHRWHKAQAARVIAEHMLRLMRNLHGAKFDFSAAMTAPGLESQKVRV